MAKRKLVVIEDGLLASMASNDAIRAEFPFIANLQHAKPAGGGCCGHGAAAHRSVFGGVKQTIANLTSAKIARLKELLNAEQLRVTYLDQRGRACTRTFS
jgi:hypothetical protein